MNQLSETEKKWNKYFGIEIANSPFGKTLLHLAPPITESFQEFKGERIDDELLDASRSWFKSFVKDDFNPFAGDKKNLTKGYLMHDKNADGILSYTWDTKKYHVEVQERVGSVFYRIRPNDRKFNPKEGVDDEILSEFIGEVLSKYLLKNMAPKELYSLTQKSKPGDIYKSFRLDEKDVERYYPDSYLEHAFVLSDRDLCFFFFKKTPNAQIKNLGGMISERWLPSHLRKSDSDELVAPPPKP